MAYYDQGNPEAGKSRNGKTPGRLHDDRRWRSMVWAFFGLVIGLLFGAIGTALMGDAASRGPITLTPPAPTDRTELAVTPDACSLTADGAISDTPCLLDSAVLSDLMDPDSPINLLGSRGSVAQPPAPLPLCERSDDGAITGAPCRILASLPAPRPVAPAGVANDLPPPCTVGTDGSVTGARCILSANIAPPPPAVDPIPTCQVSMMDGTVTGAPCRLAANFRANQASRTLERDVAPRTPPLADCRIDQATQSITNAPCKLDAAFRPVLDANFGPVPKSALKVCPTGGFTTPEDLGCGLRVRDSGYVSLSKIAEAYYGDTDAACLIFDRNKDVFGTRESPIRRNDPHCILPEDILFMPATTPETDFGRCVTPPRRANVCEAG